MIVSVYFYLPFTLVIAVLLIFTKSERKAAADRLHHATYKERQQRNLAEMQLRVLQAQIEPHFLYNTMAHLGILIHDEPNTAYALSGSVHNLSARCLTHCQQISCTAQNRN